MSSLPPSIAAINRFRDKGNHPVHQIHRSRTQNAAVWYFLRKGTQGRNYDDLRAQLMVVKIASDAPASRKRLLNEAEALTKIKNTYAGERFGAANVEGADREEGRQIMQRFCHLDDCDLATVEQHGASQLEDAWWITTRAIYPSFTLQHYIDNLHAQRQPAPGHFTAHVFLELFSAVKFLQEEHGIAHNELVERNVLLDLWTRTPKQFPIIKLIDFGSATCAPLASSPDEVCANDVDKQNDVKAIYTIISNLEKIRRQYVTGDIDRLDDEMRKDKVFQEWDKRSKITQYYTREGLKKSGGLANLWKEARFFCEVMVGKVQPQEAITFLNLAMLQPAQATKAVVPDQLLGGISRIDPASGMLTVV
ncbi:hypothetical protein BDV96DRAFT_593584 [Lophiotrema nucula]|uniref:Protein kinase domain-containing protein n=1 Tax=Lophiotrema nucula TaxID=690887 RepID=A0A6A5ZVR3_9PLEO|nr:hypothetical protein BDV96DRAFT_593584 [Lophiotrema nucula]